VKPAAVDIEVFVLSDVRFYREGLAEVLAATQQIEVVGTGPATDEGVQIAAGLDPDVVLLDTGMANGVEIAQRVAVKMPRAKIVALAVPESEEELILLVEAGVLGYVTREESLNEVVGAIVNVVREQMVGSPKVRTLLIRRVRALAAEFRPPVQAALTTREHQILDLIALGMTNKGIANELQIEAATVKNHVHNILHKLGVGSRAAAVAEVRRAARHVPAVTAAERGSAA
jgi:two-component system nitrate/nitrite response regulator NarL